MSAGAAPAIQDACALLKAQLALDDGNFMVCVPHPFVVPVKRHALVCLPSDLVRICQRVHEILLGPNIWPLAAKSEGKPLLAFPDIAQGPGTIGSRCVGEHCPQSTVVHTELSVDHATLSANA